MGSTQRFLTPRLTKAVALFFLRLTAALAISQSPAHAIEIAVDVGHTLAAPGATSARGRTEFEFNQILAAKVATALEQKNFKVRRVNFDGMIGSLDARPQAALGSDFFISIHHDSVQWWMLEYWDYEGQTLSYSDRFVGFSMFVSHNNPNLPLSLRCASAIGTQLQAEGFTRATHHAHSMPGRNRPYADEQNAVHYYDNLVVLYRTTLPALLFEAGIIKHRAEEMALRDPDLQDKMAESIATGIANCMDQKAASSSLNTGLTPSASTTGDTP